jgi:hypothetical protein
MVNRLMSDAEIRRRKKVQGTTSKITSTLGLTGVGLGAGALLASRKPQSVKHLKKIPGVKGKHIKEQKLKNAGLYTSLASGGVSGVAGYNFAAYTNAESRKRGPRPMVHQQKKIKKSANVSAFGVTHD